MKDDPDDTQQGDNQVQLVPPGVEVAVGAAKTTFYVVIADSAKMDMNLEMKYM
jgi:hypothetical protein